MQNKSKYKLGYVLKCQFKKSKCAFIIPCERSLSGDQGPSLRLHGNVLGDTERRVLSGSSRKRKQEGLDVCIHYIKLNLVVNDSDFVILGLDLL